MVSSLATKVNAILFLFAVMVLPRAVNAANTLYILPVTEWEATTGYATATVDLPDELSGHNFIIEHALKELPVDLSYHNVTAGIQCYPGPGGFNTLYATVTRTLDASVIQTGENYLGNPDCDVSGIYYSGYWDTTASSSIMYVFKYYYDVDTNLFTPFNQTYTADPSYKGDTQFISFVATGGTTLSLSATYYLDPLELDSSNPARWPTYVQFALHNKASSTSETDIIYNNESILTIGGYATSSTTYNNVADGSYEARAGFNSFGCSAGLTQCPFESVAIDCSFDVVSGSVGLTECTITQNPWNSLSGDACSLTNLSGCLRELFIPSQAELEEVIYPTLDELKYTPPWGYAIRIMEIFTEATTTGTSSPISMTLVIPETLPGAGQSLTLNAGVGLQTAFDTIADVEVSTIDGNPWDTFLLYWNRFWWWLFAFWLISQIFGTFGFSFGKERVTAYTDQLGERRRHEMKTYNTKRSSIGDTGWYETKTFRSK